MSEQEELSEQEEQPKMNLTIAEVFKALDEAGWVHRLTNQETPGSEGALGITVDKTFAGPSARVLVEAGVKNAFEGRYQLCVADSLSLDGARQYSEGALVDYDHNGRRIIAVISADPSKGQKRYITEVNIRDGDQTSYVRLQKGGEGDTLSWRRARFNMQAPVNESYFPRMRMSASEAVEAYNAGVTAFNEVAFALQLKYPQTFKSFTLMVGCTQ